MYYTNAYGHWLVTQNIKKGELVIQCTDTGKGIVKKLIIMGEDKV